MKLKSPCNAEFAKGDLVTFSAYSDEDVPAKVVDIRIDGRYSLEGILKSKPLITNTGGRFIKESSEYQQTSSAGKLRA